MARGWEPLTPRTPVPSLRLNVAVAVGVALLSAAVYVGFLRLADLPPPSTSLLLFVSAPVFAGLAVPMLWSRAASTDDPGLAWFAAGLCGTTTALVLQLIAFPTVTADGGPLATSAQATAALYLAFHVFAYLGAGVGSVASSARWSAATAVALVFVALALAQDLVPLPELIGPDQSFTPLITTLDVVIALAGVGVIVGWVRRGGSRPLAMHGWVALCLLLLTCELALNAISSRRFDTYWWASATLRSAAFGVLALGCLLHVLRQLRLVEGYTEAELDRREGELVASLSVTERLLRAAGDLSRCLTPVEVATELARWTRELTGIADVAVYQRGPDGTSAVVLVPADGSGRWPAEVRAADPTPVASAFTGSADQRGDQGSVTAWPLVVAGTTIGVLAVDDPRGLAGDRQTLVDGLTAQGAPVLSRARLFERERRAAETLQRSLLPSQLPDLPGLTLAARYEPARRGDQVGGDWYDVLPLDDGRVALVVGDVVGKGLAAASEMGQLRFSLRTLVQIDPDPGFVVSALDRSAQGRGMVATLLMLVLDPVSGTGAVARAGHLPLLLDIPGSGVVVVTDGAGPPLGMGQEPLRAAEVTFGSGATAVLFTDGLAERRDRPLDASLHDVAGRLGHEPLSVDELADVLMRGRPEPDGDDAAVLVARLVGTGR